MFGYSQAQHQWEIVYIHCCKSYSEKDKQIVNHLSSGEAGSYSKEHTKKKVPTIKTTSMKARTLPTTM